MNIRVTKQTFAHSLENITIIIIADHSTLWLDVTLVGRHVGWTTAMFLRLLGSSCLTVANTRGCLTYIMLMSTMRHKSLRLRV